VVAVAGLAPGPKFHVYVAPTGAVPVNVIVELLPMQTVPGSAVNVDVGAAVMFMVFVFVAEQAPLVTVKLMVFAPVVPQLTL
jgi:hypothetical protein